MYKWHGDFTKEAKKLIDNRLPSLRDEVRLGLLTDMIYISRMGLLPEAADVSEYIRVNGRAPVDGPTLPIVAVKATSHEGHRETHFILSQNSKTELMPVHPKLKACVELAITYSIVDFRVNQGLRTIEEQKKAVASGNSRTMHSKHLRQADGFVWAVDLVVLTNGKVDWTFETYANVAFAMDRAATELGIAGNIRWGCAWDRVLSDFGGSPKAYLDEAKAYAKRHAGSDLLDAPHFEWVA